MAIRIYNTLTRKKEEFKPISEGVVKIYNCGPTVYDYFHIGNARNFVVFDVIRRYLEYKGFKVIFVQNITDIDDKIINRAKEEGKTWKEVADKYTEEYFKDADSLGIRRADFHPKATEHIKEMIELIEKLISSGLAYELDGNVYFEVNKFPEYGRLSGQKVDELLAGTRIDINEKKKSPIDFSLWKKSKPDEPSWDSPWGPGRPGWHIECSVMSMKYLSSNFDIHGGGIDLVFPHHENEIAQSDGAVGSRVVNCWIYNGHLNISGEKMSKSIGNILLAKDILKKYNRQAIRLFLLFAHYRSPLDYNQSNIENDERGYSEIYNKYFSLMEIINASEKKSGVSSEVYNIKELVDKQKEKFILSLDDDFNTAQALGSLFELINGIKYIIAKEDVQFFKKLVLEELEYAKDTVLLLCSILGIEPTNINIDEGIRKLIKERDEARKIKNWERADSIRNLLAEKGIILEDTPSGVIAIKKH